MILNIEITCDSFQTQILTLIQNSKKKSSKLRACLLKDKEFSSQLYIFLSLNDSPFAKYFIFKQNRKMTFLILKKVSDHDLFGL